MKGQAFLDLDIGLPVRQLRQPLRDALNGKGEGETELDAINRRGKPVRCRVRCTPLHGKGIEGIIVLMEELVGGTS